MPRALQANRAREVDEHAVLCMLTDLALLLVQHSCCPHSALSREVATSLSDEGCPPCCRVSGKTTSSIIILADCALHILPYLDVRDRCAFRHTNQFWFTVRIHCHRVPATSFHPHPRARRHQTIRVVRQG